MIKVSKCLTCRNYIKSEDMSDCCRYYAEEIPLEIFREKKVCKRYSENERGYQAQIKDTETRLKYIGKSDPCCLINGKIYVCLGEEHGMYRVIDEEGVDETSEPQGYLYEKHLFEKVDS